MRRAVPVLAATAGSIVLLANFHTSPERTTVTAGAPTTAPPSSAAGTPPSSTPTTGTRTTAPPATLARRAIVGPSVLTRFGDVQVRIVVEGTHILDVEALRLPDSHQRSVEISNFAAPRLRQEALQAQSARINLISGATYTSEGYVESLQAAIDARR
jgi:uncharacterized protein with FMN-binding domain